MIDPPIDFSFHRVAPVPRIRERCWRHARALLPRMGDIEHCQVTVSSALDGDQPAYQVQVEVRRTDGEVLVDRASAPRPIGGIGNDEDLVVQTVDEALHSMRRSLARSEFDLAASSEAGGRPAPWSRNSAGSGEIWYG